MQRNRRNQNLAAAIVVSAMLCMTLVLAGCKHSDRPIGRVGARQGTLLNIYGSPAHFVTAGNPYSFTPSVTAVDGVLVFTVTNKPSWASFNVATGAISGTPEQTDVGRYADIRITATNGALTSSLPGFAIDVTAVASNSSGGSGTATLSWSAPTLNTDGSALTDLAGYTIYYGQNANGLTHTVQINSQGTTRYEITGLDSGTWYFALRSRNSTGIESDLSNIAAKSI